MIIGRSVASQCNFDRVVIRQSGRAPSLPGRRDGVFAGRHIEGNDLLTLDPGRLKRHRDRAMGRLRDMYSCIRFRRLTGLSPVVNRPSVEKKLWRSGVGEAGAGCFLRKGHMKILV